MKVIEQMLSRYAREESHHFFGRPRSWISGHRRIFRIWQAG